MLSVVPLALAWLEAVAPTVAELGEHLAAWRHLARLTQFLFRCPTVASRLAELQGVLDSWHEAFVHSPELAPAGRRSPRSRGTSQGARSRVQGARSRTHVR